MSQHLAGFLNYSGGRYVLWTFLRVPLLLKEKGLGNSGNWNDILRRRRIVFGWVRAGT